jgi:branched-chain amino acid transport system substrate-binding protein
MRTLRWIGLSMVLTLVLLMLIPGCAPKAAAPAEAVKIGLLSEYTGQFAGTAQEFELGARQRLDEAGWKVAGRTIEFSTEDDTSSADVGSEKMKKLIGVDKVDMVIGPLKMEVRSAAAAVCNEYGVPIIAPCPHQPDEVAKYSNLFALEGPLTGAGQISYMAGLGSYANQVLGYKTTVTFAPDFLFGHTVTDSTMAGFTEKGGRVLSQSWIPFGTMDFTPYLMTLTTGEKPDVVTIFCVGPNDALTIHKQYREMGLNLPVIAPEFGGVMVVLQELGANIVGDIASCAYIPAIDNAVNKKFVKDFEEKNGRPPGCFNCEGYTAMSVFLNALEATNGDASHEKIIAALEKTKMETPYGHIEIGPDRLVRMNMQIFKVVESGGGVACDIISKYPNYTPK